MWQPKYQILYVFKIKVVFTPSSYNVSASCIIIYKEFIHLKNIDPKFYASDYQDINVDKYGVKCRTPLKFWQNKGWINKIDPYGCFQWYFWYWLGRTSKDDKRQINRWKNIVSRFRGKLVKMIKNSSSKFDDYLISPKVIQILLHWSYELTEKDFERIIQ